MTKAELNHVIALQEQLARAEKRLEHLKSAVTSFSRSYSWAPRKRGQASKIEEITTAIVDTESQIATLNVEIMTATLALTKALEAADLASNVKDVLIEHYCFGRTFKEIAVKQNYSMASVFRLNRIGVRQITSDSGDGGENGVVEPIASVAGTADARGRVLLGTDSAEYH